MSNQAFFGKLAVFILIGAVVACIEAKSLAPLLIVLVVLAVLSRARRDWDRKR